LDKIPAWIFNKYKVEVLKDYEQEIIKYIDVEDPLNELTDIDFIKLAEK